MKLSNLTLFGALFVVAIAASVMVGLRPDRTSESENHRDSDRPINVTAQTESSQRASTTENDGNALTFSATRATSSTVDNDSVMEINPEDNSSDAVNQDQNPASTDAGLENDNTENTRQLLSKEVYEIIDEVQKRFEEGQWMEGANELNALYEDYESLNDFEKATVLNFYTNLLLANNMYPEAIDAFETMLEIETLRSDIRLRAIRALGQLNQAGGELNSAVSYFNQYLESTDEPSPSVLLDLANSYYELGQHREAIVPLTEHIELLIDNGEAIERNKLSLLNVLAIESGDWQSAATVNEMMIEAYNDPRDWRNLAEIYLQLGDDEKHQRLLNDAVNAGHFNQSGEWND